MEQTRNVKGTQTTKTTHLGQGSTLGRGSDQRDTSKYSAAESANLQTKSATNQPGQHNQPGQKTGSNSPQPSHGKYEDKNQRSEKR